MGYLKQIIVFIAVIVFVLLSGNAPAPPFFDAVTAATSPPDNSNETVKNLRAEVIYWEEIDLDGGWTPYEDVDLTWEPTSNGEETGYEIWATTASCVFERIDTVNADKTEYTDYFINMYYEDVEVIEYRVRPLFGGQAGPFCEAVSVNNPGYIEPIH